MKTKHMMQCGHWADDCTEIGEPVCSQCAGKTPDAFIVQHTTEDYDVYYWYYTIAIQVPSTGYAHKAIGCVSSLSPTFPMEQVMTATDNAYDTHCDIIISDIQPIAYSDYMYLLERLARHV